MSLAFDLAEAERLLTAHNTALRERLRIDQGRAAQIERAGRRSVEVGRWYRCESGLLIPD